MFCNIADRIRLLFRKDKKPYLCFYKILGFYPRNIEVYQQALLHKSSSVKSDKGRLLNNERLEFLGDAILDAVVADIVYKKFEGKREGFLTNTRSKIVQRETLNRVAVQLGLDKLIKYTTRQPSHNSYVYGNAFEALVGAIYLDRGYDACMKFMKERVIAPYLNLDKVSRKEVNFKSRLIEWSQKNRFEISFELVAESVDQDMNPIFETKILVEQVEAGTGKGYSKKESQQEASRVTLTKIKKDPLFIDNIFASKAQREQKNEAPAAETQQEQPNAQSLQELIEEETPSERFDDVDRIIALAERAAFAQSDTPEPQK